MEYPDETQHRGPRRIRLDTARRAPRSQLAPALSPTDLLRGRPIVPDPEKESGNTGKRGGVDEAMGASYSRPSPLKLDTYYYSAVKCSGCYSEHRRYYFGRILLAKVP